ncbi:hypothetical protein AGMMS50256_16850 [Betaproteobacteria bacterium]|nr:hypothetical protein AGMMS50256_16850 [Betaproteobacteria bacterium]
MIFLLPALAQSPVDNGPASAPAAAADTPAETTPRPTLPHLILEQVTGFLGLPGPVQPGTKASSSGPAHDPAYDPFPQDDPTPGRRNGTLKLSELKPLEIARDKARNYGTNWLNSSAETLLSGLVDNGRARVNFNIDWDGHLQGEGDVLLPIHDSPRTTVFTQIGARSMASSDSKDRWIGNFGLGQRWFPYAQDLQNAGNLMLGYNAFFDQDFSRSHQRGSVGGEIQYDWLRLASNYYFPLSGWKVSPDFDHRLIEERPAKGWDLRVKAYLPTYRNLAFTGAYTRWSGEHVGVSGARHLEKDPREWSYGVEYTPIPLISGFVRNRHVEGGRNDTEFGLNLTYHFGMPWEQQLRHSKVAELRTVSASRHEFVDRENKIILEYKAGKAYHIELTGFNKASGEFILRLRNGFDEFPDDVTVTVRASHGATLARKEAAAPTTPTAPASFLARAAEALRTLRTLQEIFSIKTAHAADFSKTYLTSGGGYVRGTLSNTVTGPVTVTAQAGNSTARFTVNVIGVNDVTSLSAAADSIPVAQALSAGLTLNFKAYQDGIAQTGQNIRWSIVSDATGRALLNGQGNTDGEGQATATLKLTAAGAGAITVRAELAGESGLHAEATVTVTKVPEVPTLPNAPTVNSDNALADGVAENKLSLQVHDGANGINAGAGLTVTWTITSPDPATGLTLANGGISTTNADGVAEMSVTDSSGLAREVSLRATLKGSGGTSQEQSATAHFTAIAYALPHPVSVIADAALPDGVAENRLSIQVYDLSHNTNAGAGVSVTWTIVSPSPATGLTLGNNGASTTDASGVAGITLTDSEGQPRAVTLLATVDGGGAGKEQNATLQFSAIAYALPNAVSVVSDNALANGKAENKLRVQVHDLSHNANAGAGVTVTWTITSPDPAGLTLGNNGISVTNAGGVAEMSVTDSRGLARAVTLKATVEGSGTGGGSVREQSVTVRFTDSYALPNAVSVATDYSPPDGVTANRLSVQVYDNANGRNAGAGVTVIWTIVSPSPATGLTLAGGGASTTNAGGVAEMSVTDSSGLSRAVTLRARVGAGGTGREQSATVNFAAPAPPPVYTLEASTDTLMQHAATGVTFTVRQDGTPVSAGTAVSFTANSGFQNLPGGAQNTDGSGRITVSNLTATASGNQTVTATVGGQTVSVSFAVTGAYTLEAAPTALTQNTPASVTFTVKQDGTVVPANTAVTFAASSFTGLAGVRTTDGNGRISLSLTATASGAQTVSATVGGQTVSVSFMVTGAYTLEAAPTALTQNTPTSVIFTVRQGGTLVPANTAVSFNTSSPNFTGLPAGAQNTDASGQITVTNLTATAIGAQPVTATVDGQTVNVSFTVTAPVLTLTLTPAGGGDFVSSGSITATITAVAKRDNSPVSIDTNPVTWTVVNSYIGAAWWGDSSGRSRTSGAMNGLAWGTTPISLNGYEDQRTDMSGNGGSPGTGATATLTDIVGSRRVELRAEVSINGETYTGTTAIDFGKGPLSEFREAPRGSMNWADAGTACGNNPGNPASPGYQPNTKLPRQEQLQAVAGSGSGGRQGAAHAAGWRDDTNGSGWFRYWAGEALGIGGNAVNVGLDIGNTGSSGYDTPVAVCVP